MSNRRLWSARIFLLAAVLLASPVAPLEAREFELDSKEDKVTFQFQPKGPGKVVLTGKWEGTAKVLDVGLYMPTAWLAHRRTTVKQNPFEMTWDLNEKELEEGTNRPWKIVLRTTGGSAKGEADVTGDALQTEEERASKTKKDAPRSEADPGLSAPVREEGPPIALDDFGLRVRRGFLETPYYKPWVDKITSGKKNAKIDIRPLGLTVTPSIRKIQTRYGSLSLTVRNITLTPAQNVSLVESISGGVETRIELLIRVELPGWHLLAVQLSPFTAYTGEPPRLTSMQIETRSLSRGEVIPSTSYPLASGESILLVPIILSQPGEYLVSAQPIAREPSEVLFILGGIELYRLSN
ncbi:MAG: hypothetical protein A3G34_02095 [Candidatus Lindowbacteria bacterium RIFCSPLOWO2_12_FULL_62_27]|nr:MAG: hypothetical protein A3G34_02095 [Candidatus Lindowbacteria bacterium RIFCSPLOWO2_12_FULL_62_27]OGH61240.1 MAG: hypothetical protein A3I06_15695 [Candidatus Lindowbacteria bacterium RIFCSPLOWO2_02_FULL_62_12]